MCDYLTVTESAAFFLFLFLFYWYLRIMHMNLVKETVCGYGGYIQKVTLFAKMLNCVADCDSSNYKKNSICAL